MKIACLYEHREDQGSTGWGVFILRGLAILSQQLFSEDHFMASQTPARPKRSLGSLIGIGRTFRLAWRLFRDRRVPIWVKAVPFLALAYVLWPLDVFPDFGFGLGQLDDLGIILIGIKAFIGLCPQDLVRGYEETDKSYQDVTLFEGDVIDADYRLVEDGRSNQDSER